MINRATIQNIVDKYSQNTLSLYIRVDPSDRVNQADNPAWNIHLKNAMSQIESEMDKDNQDIWESIHRRLDEFLTSYQPKGRALVIFMDENKEYVQELPFALRNRSHFGKPIVSPLLWAIDEYKQYLIVTVDKNKATFHKTYLGNLELEAEMTIDLAYDWGEKTLMPATGGDGHALRQGNNREAFEDMINAHIDRFYKDVAEEIRRIFDADKPMRLILGGDERSSHAIQHKLHESITEHLVAILPIPIDANVKTIMQRIGQTAYNYERHFELDLVEDITSKAQANGRGVLGRSDLARAMDMQQVELVILPFRLIQDEPDYAHDLAIWALDNNRNIEFVHGPAATELEKHGDVAGRLYYSIAPA